MGCQVCGDPLYGDDFAMEHATCAVCRERAGDASDRELYMAFLLHLQAAQLVRLKLGALRQLAADLPALQARARSPEPVGGAIALALEQLGRAYEQAEAEVRTARQRTEAARLALLPSKEETR